MYEIGEALIGKGDEIAHIDLIIGNKDGVAGQAFASGMSNLSKGHTPVLAVIRPNLPAKPFTLIVPKVTIKNLKDAGKIFGPAQTAVSRAIADSVEEGVIPKDKIDELVVICSVFIHPNAKDYRRIYQYNYGATKLALKRAMKHYPPVDYIISEKDKSLHPIMGFRVPRLPKWNTPYLQIALDHPSIEKARQVLKELPGSDKIIIEAGTPLIKKYGVNVIQDLRKSTDAFIIADLKTLDVGQIEVDMAFDETADAVVASGLAPIETLDKFIYESHRVGIYAVIDFLNVPNVIEILKSLKELPDVVILHKGIDTEKAKEEKIFSDAGDRFYLIKKVKELSSRILVSVAGGIEPNNVKDAIDSGVDIIIVGRYITQSKDIERATREFLIQMGADIDLKRIHTE